MNLPKGGGRKIIPSEEFELAYAAWSKWISQYNEGKQWGVVKINRIPIGRPFK